MVKFESIFFILPSRVSRALCCVLSVLAEHSDTDGLSTTLASFMVNEETITIVWTGFSFIL